MFENLVECAKNKKRDNKWAYFLVTSIAWTLALGITIAAGIFLYEAKIDQQLSLITMLETPLPPPPPPLGNPRPASGRMQPAAATMTLPINTAVINPPTSLNIPAVTNVAFLPDALPGDGSEFGDPRGAVGGSIGGQIGGVLNSPGGASAELPPPPPKQEPVVVEPKKETPPPPPFVRRSEGVLKGNAINRVTPDYPTLARAARISGDVALEITIGEDGSVTSVQVISGHAMLQNAAVQAARQWRFNPTLLNGTPVKVKGVLTFKFTL